MADIPVKIYRSSTVRPGTSPSNPSFPADEEPVIENPAGTPVSTYKKLGDTLDKTFNGKNGFVPIVVNESELQLVPLPQLQENGLISGGIVQWTGSGYVFNGSGAFYRIGGSAYSSPATQLTLSAPDPTDDRIDVFAVDVNGDMVVIEGTPAATPVKPQIDPATQLELTSVIVTASSTEPTLTEEILYDDSAIWTGTSGGSGTVNFTSTADPCQGTNSIEVTNAQNGTYVQFDNGSELDISPFQTFGFILKLKSNMPNGQTIALGLYDGSMNAVISPIPLSFDKSSTDCQFVGIVLSGQSFVSLNVRYVRFQYIRFSGATTYSGFFLDMVKFEGGINPPVTVGLSGSGTAGEIAYFTASTALASLPVSTYPSIAELAHVKGVTSAVQAQLDDRYTKSESDPLASTGSVIEFDRPRTYNDPSSPNTNTTLTEDNTPFRPVTQVIFHQAASFAPPSTWELSTGSDDYDPAKINVIYVEAFSATYKRYIIDHDE